MNGESTHGLTRSETCERQANGGLSVPTDWNGRYSVKSDPNKVSSACL